METEPPRRRVARRRTEIRPVLCDQPGTEQREDRRPDRQVYRPGKGQGRRGAENHEPGLVLVDALPEEMDAGPQLVSLDPDHLSHGATVGTGEAARNRQHPGLDSGQFLGFQAGELRASPLATAFLVCDDLHVPMTVLIVDDHAGFRDSARTLLELEGFDVIGEAADASSALELAERLEPELVLVDVGLPGRSGFEVAESLARTSKVILVSTRAPGDFGDRVRRSGALAFLSKDSLSGDALRALLGGSS